MEITWGCGGGEIPPPPSSAALGFPLHLGLTDAAPPCGRRNGRSVARSQDSSYLGQIQKPPSAQPAQHVLLLHPRRNPLEVLVSPSRHRNPEALDELVVLAVLVLVLKAGEYHAEIAPVYQPVGEDRVQRVVGRVSDQLAQLALFLGYSKLSQNN